MAVLSAGHMAVDTVQGAVPALLPFLVSARGYSYAAASALVLAVTVSSSIVQPLFGLVSDRRPLAWTMPLSVALAAAGIAVAGAVDAYALTFGAIVLAGLGVAAYHPEGSRFANYVAGARRATGMSLFSVGGNAGVALGPVMVTPLVVALGLSGTLLLAVPLGLVALVLAVELPRLAAARPVQDAQDDDQPPDQWRPFARLGAVIAARTFVYFGLLTFVPLYYVSVLGTSPTAGNVALALLLGGGAVGTIIGGRLADRVGRRAVLVGSMAVLPGLVAAFHATRPPVSTALAALLGAATIATFSITVVMGQEYLPRRIGVASGITLGLAIGLGGAGAPVLGLVADAVGLSTTLWVIAVLPLAGLAISLRLPPAAQDHSIASQT
jgi:FSR family fosmidomycin resistance protein-like MFS transporter